MSFTIPFREEIVLRSSEACMHATAVLIPLTLMANMGTTGWTLYKLLLVSQCNEPQF